MKKIKRFTINHPMRLGIIISGAGRTLQNLIDSHRYHGMRRSKIAMVIATKRNIGGIEIASANKIPTEIIHRNNYSNDQNINDQYWSDSVFEQMRKHNINLVVLAGCVNRLIVAPDFTNRVINIHPSLIPMFSGKGWYGMKIHQAVWSRGLPISGCTVHFVNNEYDAGPIIAQKMTQINKCQNAEEIGKLVFQDECLLLPFVVKQIAAGDIEFLPDGRVKVHGHAGGMIHH